MNVVQHTIARRPGVIKNSFSFAQFQYATAVCACALISLVLVSANLLQIVHAALKDLQPTITVEQVEEAAYATRILFEDYQAQRMEQLVASVVSKQETVEQAVVQVVQQGVQEQQSQSQPEQAEVAVTEQVAEVVQEVPEVSTGVSEEPTAVSSSTYYSEIPLSAELQTVLFETSASYGMDPAIILGMIETQSSFQTDVVSSVGCYGLMQLNPSVFGSGLSPAENLRTGIQYIAELFAKYGNIHVALICYNCGETGANRSYFSKGLYTSSYSEKVVSRAQKWRAIIN